jgi:hypothetical protein
MSVQVDEATVRQFIEIISAHVRQAINGAGPPGVLQICRINPIDESVVPSRFMLDDIENMTKTAIGDATAGHNVYIEARTVRPDLRGSLRGSLDDTVWVFGLVVDSDADKGKGGDIQGTAEPCHRDLAREFSLLVPVHARHSSRAGKADRRGHPRELRR